MVAVPGGIDAAALPGATVFGDTPPDTPETVSFVMRERNLSELETSVQHGVQHYLSVSQFAATYGQTRANIAALQSYLAGFGITTQVYADDVDVVANGTAGEFDSALAVQQKQYRVPAMSGVDGLQSIPAQDVYGASAPPELPSSIAQNVVAILGLTNYGPGQSQTLRANPGFMQQQAGSGSSSSCLALSGLPDACHTPADFAREYGLDPLYQQGAQGQGQTLAIVTLAALDQGAPQYFWHNVLGLPATNRTVNVVNVDGGPGAPSYTSGSDETDLDVEQSGAVARDANVIVYQAPNTDYGWVDAFFDAASENLASSVSTSWLASETVVAAAIASGQESPGWQQAFDEAFLELAVQGQSAFGCSGDWGAYSASEDLGTTNLSVESPENSPYITAAGGTTLPWSGVLSPATFGLSSGGSAAVSVPAQRTWGWDYLWPAFAAVFQLPLSTAAETDIGGSGGGFSTFEPEPSYQQDVPGTRTFSAVPYLIPTDYQPISGLVEPTAWDFEATPAVITGFGSGRAMPDVSTNADPFSGYLLYSPSFVPAGEPALEGGWGGTSFVAPELNASTAVIDSYLGKRVGFWNPAIYSFATGPNSPFTPLDQRGTGSDNIYYTGTPGQLYNEGSGLGYPDLSRLADDFR